MPTDKELIDDLRGEIQKCSSRNHVLRVNLNAAVGVINSLKKELKNPDSLTDKIIKVQEELAILRKQHNQRTNDMIRTQKRLAEVLKDA